ncbi:MAG: protein kinase domain-containing protein, partial [Gemmatimonadales bacterium]
MTHPLHDLAAALADRYHVERELGRGGMATVYLAQDLKHDRPVALKVLHPALAAALGPERFHREIMLAARLQHPHVLGVHDSGEAAGQLWFTMPFVEGESLRSRLARERQLPVEDALRIVREAALGLEYAHQHGVIHRDIKPENLLLTTDGSTLVADFGVARALGGGEQQLTGTGIAVGTAAYMSPEQARGERQLDARTDVYALGCVLYEMLAGEPPFTGPTAQAIIARAMTGTPRPIHPMRAGVPDGLDAVIARAMAVTPADRYPSAAEFARALGPVVTAEVRPAAAPRPRFAALPQFLRRRPLFATLAFGFLLGVGALFAWRWTHRGGEAAGAKFLAVLPFENLGAPEVEYFADGITDEVRGRLSALPGLQVISSGSAKPYKGTTKSPQQVARELGVQYLLVGKIRWQKAPGGASRVQVSPELIQVATGTPITKWQQPFDAALTDVFQVQADIASRVAQALDIALGAGAQQQLAARPTQNLAAYDAFLRGEAASQAVGVADPPSLRRAVAYYEQAVALDSTFVQAWAQLSRAHSVLYFNSTPTPAEAEAARQAAERALALAPARSEGHLALGDYYSAVLGDPARAVEQYTLGRRNAPNDAELLSGTAWSEQGLGRWEAALEHFRRAARLDPRSVGTTRGLGFMLLWLRRYSEALQTYDRALALAPAHVSLLEERAMVLLAQGDLAGARAVLRGAPPEVEPTALVAYVALYWDLVWLLDDAQQALLLRLTPSAFDGDRGSWGIVLAQTYALRGDRARTRAYADSARLAFEGQLRATPGDAQRHGFHGLALAHLGRKAEAMGEGERGVALVPVGKDAYTGPYFQHQLARIYIVLNEPEKALDQLEPLL